MLKTQIETFKNEIVKDERVLSGTISGYLPVQPANRAESVVFLEGRLNDGLSAPMQNWRVDFDYIKTMGMKIVQGRDFSREFSTDKTAMIINQAAVNHFGLEEPLGKKISRGVSAGGGVITYTVIGVVKDFNYESLRDAIGPLVMFLERSDANITFRIKSEDVTGVIYRIRETWTQFVPGQPLEFSFVDNRFEAMYRAERRIGKIFAVFAGLAIIIGCLGLFSLAAFTSEQRVKEIGIRKVLGASVPSIIKLLSWEFIICVGLANIIAWPVAYIIMNRWLMGFAYRTPVSPVIFIFAALITLIISLLTVLYQSVRTAVANPVNALKYE
jgi:putative ABC transport system permease protein